MTAQSQHAHAPFCNLRQSQSTLVNSNKICITTWLFTAVPNQNERSNLGLPEASILTKQCLIGSVTQITNTCPLISSIHWKPNPDKVRTYHCLVCNEEIVKEVIKAACESKEGGDASTGVKYLSFIPPSQTDSTGNSGNSTTSGMEGKIALIHSTCLGHPITANVLDELKGGYKETVIDIETERQAPRNLPAGSTPIIGRNR
ncbi:hypothetical protein BJ508DRAFT_74677 [Ascobolus immersus RN42]|uniref:Uncharacterized protein n=1 Tax=Ascobolus immersus RN42 TaxID=1160509 RepID=A0A3N4ICN1_ASCIM|nr:hypothetical protein BJ508DRAFT_74677 [Ascobolus immersus RN42]